MSLKEELDSLYNKHYMADEAGVNASYETLVKPAVIKAASEGHANCGFLWSEMGFKSTRQNKELLFKMLRKEGLSCYDDSVVKNCFRVSGWGDVPKRVTRDSAFFEMASEVEEMLKSINAAFAYKHSR